MMLIVLLVHMATLARVVAGEEGGEIVTTQPEPTSATSSYFPGTF